MSGDTLRSEQPTDEDELGPWGRWRARVAQRRSLDLTYRVTVAMVGTVVLVLGVIAIPYPGPGWLIVFAGLGILASEFAWAQRVLHWVKHRYDRFMDWFTAQGWVVKSAGIVLTAGVVIGTLWVLGTFGLVGGWVGIEHPWLSSPIF